jgi:ribosome-associated protein
MAKRNALTGSTPRRAKKSVAAVSRAKRKTAARPIPGDPVVPGTEPRAEAVAKKKPARRAAAKFPKPVTGAVQAALDKKAEDVVLLDMRDSGGFTDFFIICTGGNARHVSAIADGVRETLKREFDERPGLVEGIDRSEWILLDYFNFVVHVFSRDCRAFYGLERLWGAAERHEFKDEGPRRT